MAVPEIPVLNIEKAGEYYVKALSFRLDWAMTRAGSEASRRARAVCSLTNTWFCEHCVNRGAVVEWLNLNSKL